MSKYQIVSAPNNEGIDWLIQDTETGMYFDGYDFMGGVDWNPSSISCSYMGYEEAEQIVKDLEAADEPAEPETEPAKIVINTDDLMKGLKAFLETIGCTNVQITNLTDEQIAKLEAEATEI